MTSPQTVVIKLRLRLNKSHSSDYDNISDYVAMEAVNKAQLQVFRRIIHGANRTQEGDEETRFRIDDLQNFLITKSLKGKNKKGFFESDTLPDNYLWFKNIVPKATKEECKGQMMYSRLVEEANVPRYLTDWSMQPNFEWRSTFHTIATNKIRVYTADEFFVEGVNLMYYRKPQKVDIIGYTHEDGATSTNTPLEFKDDLAELIIDEAANIIAGDIELPGQYSTTKQNIEKTE